MPNYNLSFKSSAAREFRKLSPQIKQRITDAIERLIVNSRDSGVSLELDIEEMFIDKFYGNNARKRSQSFKSEG